MLSQGELFLKRRAVLCLQMQRWHPDLTPHGMGKTAATSDGITRELEQSAPEFHRLKGSLVPCLCTGSRTGRLGPGSCPVTVRGRNCIHLRLLQHRRPAELWRHPLARVGLHPVGCTTRKQPLACGLLAWKKTWQTFFLAELTPRGGLLNDQMLTRNFNLRQKEVNSQSPSRKWKQTHQSRNQRRSAVALG